MKGARARVVACEVLILAALSACHGSPTQSGPVVITGIKIVGPAGGAPRETLHFSAIVSFSDGSTRDVTANSSWTVGSAIGGLFSFSGTGQGEAVNPGEYEIVATYTSSLSTTTSKTFSDRTTVLILEPGTFKVSGLVTEAGVPPSSGVLVQVVEGNIKGRVSGLLNGRYSFFGAAGPIRIEASGGKYETQAHDLVVTANVNDDFAMVLLISPGDVSGNWVLTAVGPSSTCPPGFPQAARDRAYALRLTQHGTQLEIDLSRSTVSIVLPGLFSGNVTGSHVLIELPVIEKLASDNEVNLIDHLNATETFSFDGDIIGELSGAEILSKLSGNLVYWSSGAVSLPPTWHCFATDHVVTVKR